MIATDIAIIGGGFSGTALAIALARYGGPPSLLIHKRPYAGFGLAFSTESSEHLLNVRAGNMSAIADDPSHFVRSLPAADQATAAQAFIPRRLYGEYLADLLVETRADSLGGLALYRGEVVHLTRVGDEFLLRLEDGETVEARQVVLATGNAPPVAPQGFEAIDPEDYRYLGDPWAGLDVSELDASAQVLLIGSGLTAVDVTLQLVEQGFAGKITALSRRGLLPREHVDADPPPPLAVPPEPRVTDIARHLRRQSALIGWRHAIDQLRPHSQMLWHRMPLDEKRRFLRHARPWWDVHRHRMAPEVACRLEALRMAGQFHVARGRMLDVDASPGPLRIRWQERYGRIQTLPVERVINCTGPSFDLGSTKDPLLASLRDQQLVRSDAIGLGIATDELGRIIGGSGDIVPGLYAAGPPTRGSFWEITAVPDIRRQVWSLAKSLSGSRWSGEHVA